MKDHDTRRCAAVTIGAAEADDDASVTIKPDWAARTGRYDCTCRVFGASHRKWLQQPRGWGFYLAFGGRALILAALARHRRGPRIHCSRLRQFRCRRGIFGFLQGRRSLMVAPT